jgi:hypothetical protein
MDNVEKSVNVFYDPCSYVYLSSEKMYTKFEVYFRLIFH